MIISHRYKFIFIKTSKVGGTSLELCLNRVCGKRDVFTPHWLEEKEYNPKNYLGFFNPTSEVLTRIINNRKLFNIGLYATWNNFIQKKKFFENIPAWQLKCRVDKEIWDTYYKFTIDRNPWDKCVSRYFHSKTIFEAKYGKELTFKMWFDYFLDRIKKPWITTAWGSEAPYNFPRYANPWTDEILVDNICRYEYLEIDLYNIFKKLEVPFFGLSSYQAKGSFRKDRRNYSHFFSEMNKVKYVEKIAEVFKKEINLMNYRY